MNVGQYIDLLFVCPTYSLQIPSYLGHYITFLHLQVLWPEIGWHILSFAADCTTKIYFPVLGREIIGHIQFVTQSFHVSDKVQHCAMGRCDVTGGKFCMFVDVHIHVRSVTCPVTQFVEVYSRVFVFYGYIA
jgi:hypothetical protein